MAELKLIASFIPFLLWVWGMSLLIKDKKEKRKFVIWTLIIATIVTVVVVSNWGLLFLIIGIPVAFIDWGTKMFPIDRR